MKSYFQRVVELNGSSRVYRILGFLATLIAIRFFLAHGQEAPRVLAESTLYFLAGIAGLTFHEWAHAAAATAAGDPAPGADGRLTLNPASHLDFLGSLFIVLIGFGWAKPVRLSPFRYIRRPWVLAGVTFAGPAANMVLAGISAFAMVSLSKSGVLQISTTRLDLIDVFSAHGFAAAFLLRMVLVNCILGVFNMIPIPPLDGGSMLMLAFTGDSEASGKIGSQGFLFLLILMAFTRVDTLVYDAGVAMTRTIFSLAATLA